MSDLPIGRGQLVRRNRRYLVQIAYMEPAALLPWVQRMGREKTSRAE